VQGDRTVGITEIPNDSLLDGLARVFGFEPPRNKGHNALEAVEAIRDRRSKALVCLGGNLAVAISDPEVTFKAMRNLDLVVHIGTKLNRSHLLLAKQSFILPCLGRTEIDFQTTGPQSVIVEDSMSMVHASRSGLKPASEHLKSEPAIIAEMALATLPNTRVEWAELVSDYGKIRDCIEAVFPEFGDFNARIRQPGGFRLYVAASEREWRTPTKKANFLVCPGTDEDPRVANREALTLTTIRSHDQYNTTIYGMNDRYRGITGRRDVVFVNERDLSSRGLKHGDVVDMTVVADAESKTGPACHAQYDGDRIQYRARISRGLLSGGKCPGCARSLRRQIWNAFLQVDPGSDLRFAKPDVKLMCAAAGVGRRRCRQRVYRIWFICGDGIPHDRQGGRVPPGDLGSADRSYANCQAARPTLPLAPVFLRRASWPFLHFLKRAGFNLADAFTRHVEFSREIFQCQWFVDQMPGFEDAAFAAG
jgi:hypothetical protein